MKKSSIFLIYKALCSTKPEEKCKIILDLYNSAQCENYYNVNVTSRPILLEPGRPAQPILVSPKSLPKRSLHNEEGRLCLMHSIAHIEFNAINLACDAIYRFSGMPEKYYQDWLQVAVDEARHFQMLQQYLLNHASYYGAYPAHNGLWSMAKKTCDSVLARMALIPRVLEARGLDVTPKMIQSLEKVGDLEAVAILSTIYQEEIQHVAFGSYWFNFLCGKDKLNPEVTFRNLVKEYFAGTLRGPFNFPARQQAGFTETDLEYLANQS